MRKSWLKWFLLIVTGIAIFFRFYEIDRLPGEIFGDMSQNLIHVDSLLKGEYRLIYGYDGREGMWFYLVATIAKFVGNSYLALKLTAAVVGTITVVMLCVLGKELGNHYLGLTAATLMAVSKWNVVFSRIGFRVVLVPLFVTMVIYTYVRAKRTGSIFLYIVTGAILGLGMYTYPAFKVMVVIMIINFVFDYFLNHKKLKSYLLILSSFFVVCIPMALDIRKNPEQYTSHTKQMLLNEEGVIRPDWAVTICKNIINQTLMFNYQGDIVFRVNPVKQPLLDPISGVFFWVGLVAWFLTKKKEGLLLLTVFILMQLPSILVLNNPQDIPSGTRSLGVTPIVHLMTAYGLWIVVTKIRLRLMWRYGFVSIILLIVGIINWHNYFNVYAYGLPNHNQAYDRIVAEYIQEQPEDVEIVIFDCCWADFGTPEPEGISWIVGESRQIRYVKKEETLSFDKISKTLFVLPPSVDIIGAGFYPETKYDKYGKAVFRAVKNYDGK